MNVPGNKAEMVQLIEEEHAVLQKWIEPLDDAMVSEPGIEAGWAGKPVAIKDILVHVTLWEKRMLARVRQATHGDLSRNPLHQLPTDEFSERIYQENRDRTAADVLSDYRETYDAVLKAINELDDEALTSINAHGVVRYNTYSHYRWAVKKIRPWIRAQQRTAAGK